MSLRLKTKRCPRCQELYTPQGFFGHLRIGHGMDLEEARQVTAAAAQLPDHLPEDTPQRLAALPIGLAVAGGVLVLGVLLALHERNVVACTSCGTTLNVSKAREAGADVVRCPKCGALVQLP